MLLFILTTLVGCGEKEIDSASEDSAEESQ